MLGAVKRVVGGWFRMAVGSPEAEQTAVTSRERFASYGGRKQTIFRPTVKNQPVLRDPGGSGQVHRTPSATMGGCV